MFNKNVMLLAVSIYVHHSNTMKNKISIPIIALGFCLLLSNTSITGQSIVAIQGQAGFVMCTKTGEIYVVNANTGTSKLITTAPSAIAINSLATDTSRGIIYYCYNNYISTNKSIHGYNYRTNTHFTLINDFSTAPGSPMVGLGGVGTAGATFYEGSLYFGVELARNLSPAVPNIGANVPYSNRLYKITTNAAGTSIVTTSLVKDYYNDNGFVYYSSTPMGSNITSFFQYDHNWGDFVIINDTLYDRSVKGYTSGSFYFEQTTVAYKLSAPAVQVFNTLTMPATTVLNDGFSYVQTASDGEGNLILVGNEGNSNQFFLKADKTNGSYNLADAKQLTENGASFAKAVTDCGNVIKGEGSIGDKVWFDQNENGVMDVTENGLQYVPVELWEDVNNNGLIEETGDKLIGSAITNVNGSYGFIHMLQGNYLVRCVLSISVNYPGQGFSASYPLNPLAVSARLIDAGDETLAGSNSTNLISKNFSNLVFNDPSNDFGFADVFIVVALNNIQLKATYANHSVKLNAEISLPGTDATYNIERSVDGKIFNTIINGALIYTGSKITTTDLDLNLPSGNAHLYYRLKLIYKNGQQEQSRTVRIILPDAFMEKAEVFPNPAQLKTTLFIPPSLLNIPVVITLTNSYGQVLKQMLIVNTQKTAEINLSGLINGIYFWKLNAANDPKLFFSGKLEIK
jgi:hypothetical protein